MKTREALVSENSYEGTEEQEPKAQHMERLRLRSRSAAAAAARARRAALINFGRCVVSLSRCGLKPEGLLLWVPRTGSTATPCAREAWLAPCWALSGLTTRPSGRSSACSRAGRSSSQRLRRRLCPRRASSTAVLACGALRRVARTSRSCRAALLPWPRARMCWSGLGSRLLWAGERVCDPASRARTSPSWTRSRRVARRLAWRSLTGAQVATGDEVPSRVERADPDQQLLGAGKLAAREEEARRARAPAPRALARLRSPGAARRRRSGRRGGSARRRWRAARRAAAAAPSRRRARPAPSRRQP